MVGVLSSAARMPLPGATSAWAVLIMNARSMVHPPASLPDPALLDS